MLFTSAVVLTFLKGTVIVMETFWTSVVSAAVQESRKVIASLDGNQFDALGVCGGSCEADADADGICDDVDSCVGEPDALGDCGGECLLDGDGDGICDWSGQRVSLSCQGESFLTYQGYDYELVEIGGHCWFAENLQVESFNDGTPIPRYDDSFNWSGQAPLVPVRCAYEGQDSLASKFGYLYNWHVANNDKNVCPTGWEVPELNGELGWMCLFNAMGGANNLDLGIWSEEQLQFTGVTASGFEMLPTGYRWNTGVFENIDNYTFFWGSEPEFRRKHCTQLGLLFGSNVAQEVTGSKGDGGSIRCIKTSSQDTCIIAGCGDPEACNYLESATTFLDELCLYVDECGLCGGGGIPEGFCDCEGMVQPDAIGECDGNCASDYDLNGICDADQATLTCLDEDACNFLAEVPVDGLATLQASNEYVVDVSQGSYPGEVSWEIQLTSGETLAVGSGGDQATFEADCFVIFGLDLFGDGWNGAEMTISTNGEAVLTFVVDASEASTEFVASPRFLLQIHAFIRK